MLCYYFFDMKFFFSLITIREKADKLKRFDAKQEALLKTGREQFKAMVKKGLNVPVVFL